ncbi:MAG: CheR family methyltransferase [Plesiomonas sp.]
MNDGKQKFCEQGPQLSMREFALFKTFLLTQAGIDLADSKRALVQSRLAKRLRELNMGSFQAYWQRLSHPDEELERQCAINLLSTNETYFFREEAHFEWLRSYIQAQDRPPKVWSAACSSGEEPYTIAMIFAEQFGLGSPWLVWGTDINTNVIAHARKGIYSLERVQRVPPHLWLCYLQRGHAEFHGSVRVNPVLAKHVALSQLNLLDVSQFGELALDVIFLRNVLIYFNTTTKHQVLSQVCQHLKPGGYLLVGHSEMIRDAELPLVQEAPSRYRRIDRDPVHFKEAI